MNRNILYLVIAVVVLGGIYYLLRVTGEPKAGNEQLVEVDTAAVDEISIFHDGSTVTLSRTADGWMITNPFTYKANSSFVGTLLEKIDDMRIESLITRNADRFTEFEVDTAGTRLTVTQGDSRNDFIIGKASTGYRQTYARREGEDDVYLIRGTYGVAINRTPENWREKKFADFEREDVIRMDNGLLVVEQEATGDWRVTAGSESFVADQTKVERITRALANMRTSDFPGPEVYAGVNWERPEKEVTIGLSSGANRTVRFYPVPDEDNRYFVKYDNNETVYRVYSGVPNQIFKEADDLRADEPQPADIE